MKLIQQNREKILAECKQRERIEEEGEKENVHRYMRGVKRK